MSAHNASAGIGQTCGAHVAATVAADRPVDVQAIYCYPDDQLPHLPDRRTAPAVLPLGTPLPRQGDLVYVSSTSAWLVVTVVHEWLTPVDLRIEVWLEHAGHARAVRPAECKLTH